MPGRARIRWSTVVGGADGLAITDDALVVVDSELIQTYDLSSGVPRWSAEMSDTAGQTPVVVTPDGVVVVAPPFEEVQAFDAATGAARPVPVDVSVPGPVRDERLPDGYRFDDAGLTWHGSVVWSEASSSVPFVARLGAVTVINDFESGLRVVDDLGAVLISPPLGRRNYDETRVVVHGRMAAVVAADGCLYVIEAD